MQCFLFLLCTSAPSRFVQEMIIIFLLKYFHFVLKHNSSPFYKDVNLPESFQNAPSSIVNRQVSTVLASPASASIGEQVAVIYVERFSRLVSSVLLEREEEEKRNSCRPGCHMKPLCLYQRSMSPPLKGPMVPKYQSQLHLSLCEYADPFPEIFLQRWWYTGWSWVPGVVITYSKDAGEPFSIILLSCRRYDLSRVLYGSPRTYTGHLPP